MSTVITSSNMNLPIPIAGSDPGPDYALNVDACLTLIDLHDHTSGKGVQVTPAGLNINADLTFLSNNAIALRSARFSAQGAPIAGASDLNCAYVSGVDLYYNDGNGNQVRITQSGGVAGSPGSIGSLTAPATATYVAANKTFVWQSDTNKPAYLDACSILIRNLAVSSKALTLQAPAAMGADFTLTLPNIPSVTSIMAMDNSGAMSAPYTVDNSSIEINSNVVRVKASGVTNAMLAGSIVGYDKVSAGTIQSTQIAASTIQQSNMHSDSVGTSQIIAASVTGAKIASNVSLDGFPYSNNKFLVASNTNAASGLGIIRGAINSGGAIVIGEGFSLSYPSADRTRINFTTAFASAPVTIISPSYDGGTPFPSSIYLSTTNAYVEVIDYAAAVSPWNFSFLIIGPR